MTWDDSGRPLRQFGVLQDITELRQAEQELRASEARFRTFVDHATDAFFLLDDQSTVLDVNRQACDSLGYSREELIGKHRSDFDVGLDDASIQRLRQRIVAGETITFETRHRRKDGTSFPVEVRVGQFEQGGRRFLCLVRDITERKRAEDELRASEARFRSFVDHAMDGFFLFDEQRSFSTSIGRRCESLGYSREEMIGMHPSDFDAGLDEAVDRAARGAQVHGETVTFESLHRRKDGTSFPVEVRVRRVPARRTTVIWRWCATSRSASARRRNYARARRASASWWITHPVRSFSTDEDGTVLDLNRQACESLGYSRDELIGMTASTMVRS